MQQCHSTPDIITYNAVIDACCKSLEVDIAIELLVKMRAQVALQSPAISLITMESQIQLEVKRSSVAARMLPKCFQAFHDGLLNSGSLCFDLQNVKPNGPIYSAILEACVNAGRIDHAFQLLRMMQASKHVDAISDQLHHSPHQRPTRTQPFLASLNLRPQTFSHRSVYSIL